MNIIIEKLPDGKITLNITNEQNKRIIPIIKPKHPFIDNRSRYQCPCGDEVSRKIGEHRSMANKIRRHQNSERCKFKLLQKKCQLSL